MIAVFFAAWSARARFGPAALAVRARALILPVSTLLQSTDRLNYRD